MRSRAGPYCPFQGGLAPIHGLGPGLLVAAFAFGGCGPGAPLLPGPSVVPSGTGPIAGDGTQEENPPAPDPASPPFDCFTDEPGSGRAVFEVPRPGRVGRDPFALPFPNNLRRARGHLDFPEIAQLRPDGPDGRVVERYLGALAHDSSGFGLSPSVTFRFSRPVNQQSLFATDRRPVVRFVDITPGSDRGDREERDIPFDATLSPGGRYLCEKSLVVRPAGGLPLLPARTYAVVVTRALVDENGQAFASDADFEAVLDDARPADPALRAAWRVFQPLRAWALATGQDRAAFLSATVFTTDAVETRAAALLSAVTRQGRIRIDAFQRCGGAGPVGCGPCPETESSAAFVEYQGQLAMPVFQAGQPPYAEQGGDISYGLDSLPIVQRTEAVCFSLTVPRGSPPREGYPLVVYAHGTGGGFRWQVEHGLAEEFARGEIEGGAIPMATLGFDGVLHGSRRGGSERPSTELVYNLLNPAAARDNSLQAVADLFAVASAVSGLADRRVPVRLDRMGLYGHSQGGNAASIAAVFERRYDLVVLSGTGGGLTASLLLKEKPVAARPLLRFLLGDATVDETHPVLNLLQTYFDPVDPLVYARRLIHAPLGGRGAPHLLHVFGVGDGFAPDETQRRFGAAAHLPALHTDRGGGDPGPAGALEGPVRGNARIGGRPITAVQSRYGGAGREGHFVSTEDAAARAAILRFFGTGFRDGTPTVE